MCWIATTSAIECLETLVCEMTCYVCMTFNARRLCLSSGFSTCVEQPAVVCQECTVADDVPSRTKDCTFSVVV